MSKPYPYYAAAERIGEVPPWIRRLRIPGSDELTVQCLQCGWTFTALTGPQAVFAGADHCCWTLDSPPPDAPPPTPGGGLTT